MSSSESMLKQLEKIMHPYLWDKIDCYSTLQCITEILIQLTKRLDKLERKKNSSPVGRPRKIDKNLN